LAQAVSDQVGSAISACVDCSSRTLAMASRFAARCMVPLRAAAPFRIAQAVRPSFWNAAKLEAPRAFASHSLAFALANADVSLHARVAVLELLAENTFDSILMTDAGGKITYCNKAFTVLTGYEVEEVLGKSPNILQGDATDRKVIDRLSKALKDGGEYEGSAINYKKDGRPFIMYWRVVPVKVGGEVKSWVALQREGSSI